MLRFAPALLALGLLVTLPPRAARADVDVVPHLLVGYSDVAGEPTVPLRLGLDVMVMRGEHLGLFVGAAHAFEFSDTTTHVPMLRLGLAVPLDDEGYLHRMFPALELYGFAGRRLTEVGPDATRLGVGISSPAGLIVSAVALRYGLPVPNTFEFAVDEAADGLRTLNWTLAWAF